MSKEKIEIRNIDDMGQELKDRILAVITRKKQELEEAKSKCKKCSHKKVVKRIKKEKKELTEKVVDLEAFIESEDFKKVPEVHRGLLISQIGAMVSYANILETRIVDIKNMAKTQKKEKKK